MSEDGIANLGNNRYSITIEFSDINYNNTSETTQLNIFEKYCLFLNAYDENVQLQLFIENCQLKNRAANPFITAPGEQSKLLAGCVAEYNEMQEQRITGAKSYVQKKYLTLTVTETDIDSARRRFEQLDSDALCELRGLKSTIKRLNQVERLYLLREIFRPEDLSEISQIKMIHTGITGKDIIAPYSMEVTDQWIRLGRFYTKTFFLTDFPEELSDQIINDIMEANTDLFLTINISPQNPKSAIQETKSKLKKLDREKYDNINRQLKLQIPIPETPRDLQRALDNTEAFLSDLQARNEKMFLGNILIMIRGETLEEVNAIMQAVESKVSKNGCGMQPFTFAQEDSLNSVVPLGRNDTFVKRTFTTTSIAAFMPFHVVEIVQPNGFCYGKNKLSNNLLFLDRKRLTNPHGFIFGASGSGKSVGAKGEMWECFWRTSDDMLIVDPDGEFTKLVTALGGIVIDIGTSSQTTFNPFDINEFYGGDEEPDPVPFKSNFIISLIEVTLNYRNGIDPITKSVIDHCVREIYLPWQKTKQAADIPTFVEFFNSLKQRPEEEARFLASALEIYVEGSLNVFSRQTNVSLDGQRLVSFNTKNLGSQLKTMGMSIIQDYCWNTVSRNQSLNKNTWLWNDEIHNSLKNPYTADWLIESWKRGRKYGLIATGITQEIKDCCLNEAATSLIANSEFIVLYRHNEKMLPSIEQVVPLTPAQLNFLSTCDSGIGFFKAGNNIVEFNNRFSETTKLFSLLETDIGKEKKSAGE